MNHAILKTPNTHKAGRIRVNSNANLRAYIGGGAQSRFSGKKGSNTMKNTRHTKSTLNSAFHSRGGINDGNTPIEKGIHFEGDPKAQTSINEQSLAAQSLFKGNNTSKTISKPDLELHSQM